MKQKIISTGALFAVLFVGGPKTSLQASADGKTTDPSSLSSKMTISGTVTQSDAYSGGVKPTEERLKKLTAPRAFPGKKFHVIKGNTNIIAREIVLSFTTGEAGDFSFQLSSGTYSLIVDEQTSPPDAAKYRTQFINVDEAAFNQWWAKPYQLLEVKATNITDLKFHFHHRRFISNDIPCLRYTGPYPP